MRSDNTEATFRSATAKDEPTVGERRITVVFDCGGSSPSRQPSLSAKDSARHQFAANHSQSGRV